MITHSKTRLYILAIASAACFGFSGSANGMQKLKRYLMCTPDKNCTTSFVSGPEFWNGGSQDNKGKYLWSIEPFTLLHQSEKEKLLDSMKKACLDDKKITCQLAVASESLCFLINVKINCVKCDDGSICLFMRYANSSQCQKAL